MEKQTTAQIMMIRPAAFAYNTETAENNSFQTKDANDSPEDIKSRAIQEFDQMVQALRSKDIDVIVIEDGAAPAKPDAVFPNNWVSFHEDGTVVTYPMFAESRRNERSENIIDQIGKNYMITHRIRLEGEEEHQRFLEGTGSMILDRPNKIVYACLSPRTDHDLLEEWSDKMGYTAVVFDALDEAGEAVYHTNVIMALGQDFVVICLEAIKDSFEQQALIETLEDTGKEIIEISFQQVLSFAGNMLAINDKAGQPYLAMSEQAYKSLDKDQIEQLEQYAEIINFPIYTIEKYGGGSVRCMMAEVFLSSK